jgi:hypothetical protein
MERKQSTKRAKQQTETIAQDKAYEKHFKNINDSKMMFQDYTPPERRKDRITASKGGKVEMHVCKPN